MGTRARLLLTMPGLDTVIIGGVASALPNTTKPGAPATVRSHRTCPHISPMRQGPDEPPPSTPPPPSNSSAEAETRTKVRYDRALGAWSTRWSRLNQPLLPASFMIDTV